MIQNPHEWKADADYGPLQTWLHQMAPESEELIQMAMGYILSTLTCIKVLFVLLGEKNTGKTLLLRVVREMVGERNFATVSAQDLGNNRFAPARLAGKLLGLFDDLPTDRISDTSMLKMRCSGSEFCNLLSRHELWNLSPSQKAGSGHWRMPSFV